MDQGPVVSTDIFETSLINLSYFHQLTQGTLNKGCPMPWHKSFVEFHFH